MGGWEPMSAGDTLAVGSRPLGISAQASAAATRIVAGTATILAGALSIGSGLTPDIPWRHDLLLTFVPGTAAMLAHILAVEGGLCLLGRSLGIITLPRPHGRGA